MNYTLVELLSKADRAETDSWMKTERSEEKFYLSGEKQYILPDYTCTKKENCCVQPTCTIKTEIKDDMNEMSLLKNEEAPLPFRQQLPKEKEEVMEDNSMSVSNGNEEENLQIVCEGNDTLNETCLKVANVSPPKNSGNQMAPTISRSVISNNNNETFNEVSDPQKLFEKEKFYNCRHNGLLESLRKLRTCKYCEKYFQTFKSLELHMQLHKKTIDLKCLLCSKEFTEKSAIEVHLKSHIKSKPFWCGQCNRKFSCKDHMILHKKTHVEDKHYKCIHCPEEFSAQNDLAEHVKYHESFRSQPEENSLLLEEIYPISLCSVTSNQTVEMINKFSSEPDELRILLKDDFKCMTCSRKFKSLNSLKEHLKSSLITCNSKPHRGGRNSKLPYEDNLIFQAGMHTEKKYKCIYCSEVFSAESDLSEHVKCHDSFKSEKMKSEEISSQLISSITKNSASDFSQSQILPTKEAPYKCKYCSKTFKTRRYMKLHLKSHLGFKCILCLKEFQCKNSLNKHLNAWCKGKPFKCKYCSKSFMKMHYMRLHLKLHSEENKCMLCLKEFMGKASLKEHLMSHIKGTSLHEENLV